MAFHLQALPLFRLDNKMAGTVVVDLKQWMPSWGENHLIIEMINGDLHVDVSFDGKTGIPETRKVTFGSVYFYSVGAFPGVSSLAHKYEADFDTGCVIKTENSGLSSEWRKYCSSHGLERNCDHYVMFWGAENKVIHVVAESVETS